jgi:hypothetical protein
MRRFGGEERNNSKNHYEWDGRRVIGIGEQFSNAKTAKPVRSAVRCATDYLFVQSGVN